MTLRRQLAVASPISIAAVARATARTVVGSSVSDDAANALVARHFGAARAVTTDSGTAALVRALQLAVPVGGVVGLPGYACVDLAAAAEFANVRVRLYDLDPTTLGPDFDSLRRMLERGVNAVVAAHLFGYPVDMPAVRVETARAGVPLIEDAAQAASATLLGKPVGSFGDLSVVSFGRGKGLCAAGGGAVMAFAAPWIEKLDAAGLRPGGKGLLGLGKTAAQWALGRPSLYVVPSVIPGLRLGEMVYHPAGDPQHMSAGSRNLLASALALAAPEHARRRARAEAIGNAIRDNNSIGIAKVVPGAESGFLRYPVRDLTAHREAAPTLGILRSYPETLAEQAPLVPLLLPGESAIPGSTELRQRLFTLPTHHFVADSDMREMIRWLAVP